MPFKSKAQRRFMYSQHPELAGEFEAATPKGRKLPEKIKQAYTMYESMLAELTKQATLTQYSNFYEELVKLGHVQDQDEFYSLLKIAAPMPGESAEQWMARIRAPVYGTTPEHAMSRAGGVPYDVRDPALKTAPRVGRAFHKADVTAPGYNPASSETQQILSPETKAGYTPESKQLLAHRRQVVNSELQLPQGAENWQRPGWAKNKSFQWGPKTPFETGRQGGAIEPSTAAQRVKPRPQPASRPQTGGISTPEAFAQTQSRALPAAAMKPSIPAGRVGPPPIPAAAMGTVPGRVSSAIRPAQSLKAVGQLAKPVAAVAKPATGGLLARAGRWMQKATTGLGGKLMKAAA